MAIRITCPGCKTSLTLDDDARGTKIRCAECEKVLSIPAATKEAVQEGRKLKVKTPAAPVAEDDADEEEREVKKKKKGKTGKKGSPALLFIAAGAVAVVLLIAGGGLSAYFLFRSEPAAAAKPSPQAKLEPKDKDKSDIDAKNDQKVGGGGDPKEQKPNPPAKEKQNDKPAIRIAPTIEEGSPTRKGGTGIVQNVRGAVYRTERQSELKQLFTAFNLFCDDYKGSARTQANFLESIKTYGPIRDAVKEGYYKINITARLDGRSIIAYERDKDLAGYLSVLGDGAVRYVPEPEWKAALGIK